jgi:hypothetical protein
LDRKTKGRLFAGLFVCGVAAKKKFCARTKLVTQFGYDAHAG